VRGRAGGTQPPLNFERGRRDLLCGSEDAFQPNAQCVDVRGGWVVVVRGNELQVRADQVIEVPLGAVGEHTT